MPWLFLLLAFATLVVAFRTTSLLLMALCLLLALVLLLAWVMGWYAQRLSQQGSSARPLIDPLELKRLREQAEARQRGEGAPPPAS
jgi:hypothetical protein